MSMATHALPSYGLNHPLAARTMNGAVIIQEEKLRFACAARPDAIALQHDALYPFLSDQCTAHERFLFRAARAALALARLAVRRLANSTVSPNRRCSLVKRIGP
jgi:hypothetical protein